MNDQCKGKFREVPPSCCLAEKYLDDRTATFKEFLQTYLDIKGSNEEIINDIMKHFGNIHT